MAVHEITAVIAELAAAVLGRGKGHRAIRWEKAWDAATPVFRPRVAEQFRQSDPGAT